VIDLGLRLLDVQGFVNRFVAYELISHHPEALSRLDAGQVERLGQGLDSWESVDTFSLYVAGPVWRERQIGDRIIHRWARSDDRWWRRAALVSTVPLNLKARGGGGDTARTLSVCSLLIGDRDEMITKALSWALRALVPRDRRAVKKFLTEHQGALAARVTREVRNKLATGLKNPRKVTKRRRGNV
jgi:3-methyladenine DNA glycosylase AlkD